MHILTIDEYFGRTTGDRILQIAAIIFLALVLYGLISEYRSGMRANIYQHKNVNNLGMSIYFASLTSSSFLVFLLDIYMIIHSAKSSNEYTTKHIYPASGLRNLAGGELW